MAVKVELVDVDKAGAILERALKLRNPELWETRRANFAKARAKARKEGKPYAPPSWKPFKTPLWQGKHSEYNPIEKLGLSDLNRPVSYPRIELYIEQMDAGRWYFSPDPIVISEDGYVLNGQHRLAAADGIDWADTEEVPQFLVVWGADKQTALLMDEAKRSTNDRREIALKYAEATAERAALAHSA